MEKKKPKALMAPLKPMARMAPKMSRSQRRRILEAEGRMQQGQTGSVGKPIDVSGDTESEDYETFVNKKKGGGMLKKKGYAMGGKMKKGYAKGGKVRGAGIARKGVRPAKMR